MYGNWTGFQPFFSLQMSLILVQVDKKADIGYTANLAYEEALSVKTGKVI